MKRFACLSIVLILGGILAGCQSDPVDPSPIVPGTPGDLVKPGGGSGGGEIDLDALEYEEITGTLQPGVGAVMGDNLVSWREPDCWFALVVPPGAVPPGDPINFSMRIPTLASYQEHPELAGRLIIRLAPENVTFLEPITVVGTWMPWEDPPPDPLIYSSGSESGEANVDYLPSMDRYRITFDTDHFSDWELGPGPRKPGGI